MPNHKVSVTYQKSPNGGEVRICLEGEYFVGKNGALEPFDRAMTFRNVKVAKTWAKENKNLMLQFKQALLKTHV